MREHPAFARAMLREGVDSLISGELGVGKNILRDYVNATIGFDGLAEAVGLPPKSLMRMLSGDGNPQMRNLFEVIGALQRYAGVELHLAELPPPKKVRAKARKPVRASRPEAVRYAESSGAAHGALREGGRKFRRS
jgi:DNA-binding phage protein